MRHEALQTALRRSWRRTLTHEASLAGRIADAGVVWVVQSIDGKIVYKSLNLFRWSDFGQRCSRRGGGISCCLKHSEGLFEIVNLQTGFNLLEFFFCLAIATGASEGQAGWYPGGCNAPLSNGIHPLPDGSLFPGKALPQAPLQRQPLCFWNLQAYT
jgi:hypothetical protein